MTFSERYFASCVSGNLADDPHHSATDPLIASALASKDNFSALLVRVQYSDGDGSAENMATLLRKWKLKVAVKGRTRQWIKNDKNAEEFYAAVAEKSLKLWLDEKCGKCNGTGHKITRDGGSVKFICQACKGTGNAPIPGNGFMQEKILDMVSELKNIEQSHCGRAAKILYRK